MDLKDYRLVPVYSTCNGCAFQNKEVNSKFCNIASIANLDFNLDFVYLYRTIKCWFYSGSAPYYIYIKPTDEAYEQYCTDKFKWTLKTTD
jgi:hypothetical protein